MTTDKGIFILTHDYSDLVRALLDLHDEQAPFSNPEGRRAWIENEIKLKLGLVADIWPAEIYGDLVVDALEHADKMSH